MRIIKLETEGVKRLHAVSITPEGNVIEVTGKNGEGKSSTLDSIFYAIAGTSGIPAQPIRKGEESARIKLDLGELIVTRTFKRQADDKFTTSIKVESADGSSFKSPQSILDALLSGLTFDPLEFSRMKPRQQFDTLRAFVPDIDFAKIEDLNRGDFERRTDQNRRATEARGAAALIMIRTDLPEEEADEAALIDQIATAGQHNADIERQAEHYAQRGNDLDRSRLKVGQYRDEAAALRKKAETMDEAANTLERQIEVDMEKWLHDGSSVGTPIDVSEVRTRLTQAQATNAAIRHVGESRRRKASLEKVATDAAMLSDELTAKINERNKAKEIAIAASKMPVPGLGFGNGFITLNDLPFDQASSAEQLKASIGIAMRTNSKLRVILVKDASLLDAESFALLTELAVANDCQVWCESVFAHTDAAIVISDGRVAEEQEQESAA
jgi:DNA repair exonuclease SbcCD ATPase subunit